MARGGRRSGSGGKPTWQNGKTKVIRVPETLADLVLQLARDIDSGKLEISVTESGLVSLPVYDGVTSSKVIDLSGVSIRVFGNGPGVYLADLLAAGYEVLPEKLVRSFKVRIAQEQRERASSLKRELDSAIEQMELLEKDF